MTVLTIAGHDPSSGAGITADLQTFAAHGLFGTSAITALTIQSTLGVAQVHPLPAHLLRHTLEHLCSDLPPTGIKIGMLGSAEVARVVAEFLATFRGSQPEREGAAPALVVPVVLDPVLRSSSGAALLSADAIEVLHQELIPRVSWITPNWAELSVLTGFVISTLVKAEAAAHALASRHPYLSIVATGGESADATDLLLEPGREPRAFPGEHIRSTSTHGTGCAFSSALLSRLVLGAPPTEAVRQAKEFVAEAICSAPQLGHGKGPLNLTGK